MTPEEYAGALDALGSGIRSVRDGLIYHPDAQGAGQDAGAIVYAVANLTEATLLLAEGMRLIATPPAVEVVEAPGTFRVVDDETVADDSIDPREDNR